MATRVTLARTGKADRSQWSVILPLWSELKRDVIEHYRVDLDRDPLPCWHWLVDKVLALASMPIAGYDPEGNPILRSRLQRAL